MSEQKSEPMSAMQLQFLIGLVLFCCFSVYMAYMAIVQGPLPSNPPQETPIPIYKDAKQQAEENWRAEKAATEQRVFEEALRINRENP